MDEVFDQRDLLNRDQLRDLQQRGNAASLIRLAVQLLSFLVLVINIIRYANQPLVALPLMVALSWVWASMFPPFHESTHRTAFSSRRLNDIVAQLTGFFFGLAAGAYRAFHFEHHRHTQDPKLDPEIQTSPHVYGNWPRSVRGWLSLASGIGLIKLKVLPTVFFAFRPADQWDSIGTWAPAEDERATVKKECRALLAVWVLFFMACIVVLPGGWWLIAAAYLCHIWQALWLCTEHTGLPTSGSILEKTRSVTTNAFARWWLWNMNYHTEHHAWPGIPWHRLPDAHAIVASQLVNHAPSYSAMHREVFDTMSDAENGN